MIKNVTLGADPEIFFARNGEVISAEGMLGGSKDDPKMISEEGHSIQEDNVSAEFNIPPSSTREDFVYNIGFAMDYLEVIAKMNDAELDYRASAILDKKYLRSVQTRTLGCSVDFNVHSRSVNPRPESRNGLRSCGGHIHIGYENPNQEASEKLILAMDATIGLESLFIDTDTQRRSLYGRAGSFRFKDFGVEYRTLSNFWIASEELIGWAYDKTMEAIKLVNSEGIDQVMEYSSQIEEAINTNNKGLAEELLKKINNTKLQVA